MPAQIATPDALAPGVVLLTVADVARVAGRALPADLDVDAARLFTWGMEISNDRLDSYFTRMDPATTLANYAQDAEAGVAFLAGHNIRTLPFGQTYSGQAEAGEAGVTRVLADAYTVRGLELGGVKTNDFIAGVETRLIRAVSVGFVPGEIRCSVCGRDWLTDWTCPHWPGETYEQKGDDGVTRNVLAWGLVVDGRLVEVSAVYAGATPGAAILKAEREIALGRAEDRQIRRLEAHTRSRLPTRALLVPGATLELRTQDAPAADPATTITTDSPPPEAAAASEEEAAEVPAESDAPAPEGAAAPPAEESPADAAADRIQALEAELVRLRPLAAEGEAARQQLIAATLAEGVRALGAGFDQQAYGQLLATAPLDAVRRMRDDWAAQAAQRLPGGRLTRDVETPDLPRPATPDAAYRA